MKTNATLKTLTQLAATLIGLLVSLAVTTKKDYIIFRPWAIIPKVFSFVLIISLFNSMTGFAQCVVPPGAILLESGPSATVDFSQVATVGAGNAYYVLPGTITTINHTSKNLTISGGGKILVMQNAILYIQMGGKNMTVNGGIIQLCDNAQLLINPGHDFTMNGSSSLITLGRAASMRLCNFGHDITMNAGNIELSDYSSIEFGDYHNIISNSTNLVKYIGTGTVGTGSGNPIFHTGGSDFVNFSNTNNIGSPLTNSPHIDFINDNLGSDNPGSANYCGPKTSPTYSTCRSTWGPMAVVCGAASAFQAMLPLQIIQFTSRVESASTRLSWKISIDMNIAKFVIERSTDNNLFETIGDLHPLANTSSAYSYSYSDNHHPANDCYYRLKVIGKDGTFAYSSILLVHLDNKMSSFINCSPNPFNKYFQVNSNFQQHKLIRAELFGISGNLVTKFQQEIASGTRSTKVNLPSNMPNGVYILKITSDDGSFFQRLIKE